MIYSVVLFSFY